MPIARFKKQVFTKIEDTSKNKGGLENLDINIPRMIGDIEDYCNHLNEIGEMGCHFNAKNGEAIYSESLAISVSFIAIITGILLLFFLPDPFILKSIFAVMTTGTLVYSMLNKNFGIFSTEINKIKSKHTKLSEIFKNEDFKIKMLTSITINFHNLSKEIKNKSEELTKTMLEAEEKFNELKEILAEDRPHNLEKLVRTLKATEEINKNLKKLAGIEKFDERLEESRIKKVNY